MLTTAKPWELRTNEVIVYRGDHYTLTDTPKVGLPSIGWTTIHCTDRGGLSIALMFEGDQDINVVRVKDKTTQRESARRKGASWQSRRASGSNR